MIVISCQKTYTQGEESYDVLFIAIDDLNDWVGFLGGHPQAKTPNLDKLASQSMIFERAYCPAPVCNPSRSAIMTGRRPASTGVYGNNDFFRDSKVLKSALTLPQWFSKHGYFTTQRGKIFHHPSGKWADTLSWDKHVRLKGEGMNKHPLRGDSLLVNGMPYQTLFQTHFDWGIYPNLETEGSSDFKTAQWAANELNRQHDQPLFLACGLFRPHLPWFVPQKYFDMFPLDSVKLPPILESDLEDLPETALSISGGLESDKDWMRVSKYQKKKEAVQGYLAAIAYADDCLGVVLDGLEKSHRKEKTIVVLWGDHGWHLGEKLHYRKFTLWEEACRVPLLFKIPGKIEEGARCSRVVNLLDLYPTLTELCGIPHNPKNEGRSIKSLLNNPMEIWDYPTLTSLGFKNHTIRDERWRLIQYVDGSQELYDHDLDPQEWNNLAINPQYADTIDYLSSFFPDVNIPAVSGSGDLRGADQDKVLSKNKNP